MIISIASGKGGTGKTTVATNLAVALDTNIQLLDCDVEEPNSHLFIHPDFKGSETIYASVPEVDLNTCDRCGKCAEICQFKAITILGDTVLAFPELCHSCLGCLLACPVDAIAETGRELGVVEWGARNGIDFIHGRLRVGEAMSPPLIKNVRSRTDPEKTTIIDAPPGTSCPVIAAMKGADFILLVTEPTPFGLHDLKLAAGAVKILDIPCGLVINRSDIGNDAVEKYARDEDIDILMKIPFDRQIAESYSRGEMFVEAMPEWKQKFQELYERVENIVEMKGRRK
jgi:MinD superfamily P-loop ATPase